LLNILGFVVRFEYDSNRNTLLSLISYSIGVLSYIISIEKLYVGNFIVNTNKLSFLENKNGSALPLKYISLKESISNLESRLNGGAVFFKIIW